MILSKKNSRITNIKQVILIEGLVNLIILVTKFFVGFATGSMAIIGDAVHSLSDFTNNIIAWIIVSISNVPADENHPYGHQKFEILAVFILASILTVTAFQLFLKVFNKTQDAIITQPKWMIIMVAVLVINIFLAIWQKHWAKKLNSHILEADASHTFSDVLTTIVVIIGWQISAMGYLWIDKIITLGISGFIFYLAFTLFKRSIPILVDHISIDPEEVITIVKKVDEALEISRVRSRWIGSEKSVDMILKIKPEISVKESHIIADHIELLLKKELGIHDVSIHIEPK